MKTIFDGEADMTDKERIEKLEEENNELKEELEFVREALKKEIETKAERNDDDDNDGWEFHWDGRGSYEEARRRFYGEFG